MNWTRSGWPADVHATASRSMMTASASAAGAVTALARQGGSGRGFQRAFRQGGNSQRRPTR